MRVINQQDGVDQAAQGESLTNTEIVWKYRSELKSLIDNYVLDSAGREWNLAILKSRKADLMYRGLQWLVPTPSEGGGVDWKSINDPQVLRKIFNIGDTQPLPAVLDYSLNVLKGDVDKYCAVVGKLIPRDTAIPLGEATTEVTARIQTANIAARYMEASMDRELMPRLAKFLCLYSTSYIYTPFVADEMEFGSTMEPQYTAQAETTPGYWICPNCSEQSDDSFVDQFGPVCPGCGSEMPPDTHMAGQETYGVVEGEPIKMPNGSVKVFITNNLTTYIPAMSTDMETNPALVYQYWENLGRLRRIYKPNLDELNKKNGTNLKLEELAGFASDGSATSQAMALDQVSSPSGVVPFNARRGRGLWSRYWLHPDQYELLDDEGLSGELKELLWQRFPEGCRIDAPCGIMCNIVNEKLSAHWVAVTPEVGDFITAHNPIFEPYFNAQRLINNLCLIQMQVAMACVPIKLFNTRRLDPQHVDKLGRSVRQWVPVKSDGQNFNDVAKTLEPSKPDQAILEFMDWVHNHVKGIVGVTDALFGAGNYNTAREAIINREQAMAMLQPVYSLMKRGVSKAKYNAAMLLAKYSGGRLYHAKGLATEATAQVVDDLHDLLRGGWTYWSDESIPTSPSEQRDTVKDFANNPQLAQLLELDAPANAIKLLDMAGIPDWHLSKQDMYTSLIGDVELLLGEDQNLWPQADPVIYDAAFALRTLQGWVVSKEGRTSKSANPQGFARVKDLLLAYQQMIPPPMPEGGAPPDQGAPPPDSNPPVPPDGQGLPAMSGTGAQQLQ